MAWSRPASRPQRVLRDGASRLLRMTFFVNAIINLRHPQERPGGARLEGRYAPMALTSGCAHAFPRKRGRAWDGLAVFEAARPCLGGGVVSAIAPGLAVGDLLGGVALFQLA